MWQLAHKNYLKIILRKLKFFLCLLKSVPELSPSPPVALPTSPQHQAPGSPAVVAVGPVAVSPEQIAKLQSELDIVSMNMSVFSEMLNELKPGQEDPSDYKLLTDLSQTCKYVKCKMVKELILNSISF